VHYASLAAPQRAAGDLIHIVPVPFQYSRTRPRKLTCPDLRHPHEGHHDLHYRLHPLGRTGGSVLRAASVTVLLVRYRSLRSRWDIPGLISSAHETELGMAACDILHLP
jgi:hypothetical protein